MHRRFIDRSLVLRVRTYCVIALVALVLAVVDTVRIGGAAVGPVLAGLVVGLVIGLVVSRMFALSWDAENNKVIGRIDAVGAVILVLYLLVSVFRGQVVAIWFTRRGVRRILDIAVRGA